MYYLFLLLKQYKTKSLNAILNSSLLQSLDGNGTRSMTQTAKDRTHVSISAQHLNEEVNDTIKSINTTGCNCISKLPRALSYGMAVEA